MLWIEYHDWMRFYELEPWGCQVEDDRWTKLINTIRGVNAGEGYEWVPTKELFPRTNRDWEESEQDKAKRQQDELAFNLRNALQDHNALLVAKEAEQPPTP